jgi:hypothetical protein
VKLASHEWDFRDVPEPQLKACCIWEYARESASIRHAVKVSRIAFARLGIARPETAGRDAFQRVVNKALGLLHSTGFNVESFWLQLPFPKPWLNVDKDERAKWADFRPTMPVPVKIPAFGVTGDYFIVSHLYDLAHQANENRKAAWEQVIEAEAQRTALVNAALRGERVNVAELHKLEGRIAELQAQARERENPIPVSFMGAGGVQSFVGQINWRDCTKPEIKKAICQWIDANVPPTIPDPGERGHKPKDWENKLRDLGIMRLLHESELGNMKRRYPDAWKLYHDQKHWTERYWYLAHERAGKHFHALLPSELKTELPIHWDTKPKRTKRRN